MSSLDTHGETQYETLPADLPPDCTATFSARQRRSDLIADLAMAERALLQWRVMDEQGARVSDSDARVSTSADVDAVRDSRGNSGGFQLHRVVARGGTGEIWEALQTSLGRIVAVKRIRRDRLQRTDEETRETNIQAASFKQEALTTAALEHPNIVPIYDMGLDDEGRPLLAMKMIRGNPWSGVIRQEFHEHPPIEFLARHIPTLISVAQAVAFCHARGIIHRDIKAQQVMVGEYGEVLLTDWGLALVYDAQRLLATPAGEIAVQLTPSQHTATSPAGTPACMAPEQTLDSAGKCGPWTDLYLLGGILYQLLTGTMPHEAPTSAEAFRRAQLGAIVPPEKRAKGRTVPPELADLCMECLHEDPLRRLSSCREFITRLQDYMSGATKRDESRALTQRVIDRIKQEDEDYGTLADSNDLLMRAMSLWPQNPQLGPLRDYVQTTYARLALENGDLTLARVQAENIPDRSVRKEILEEIATAEANAAQVKKERRQLTAAFVFLLVIIGGAMYWIGDLQQQSAENLARREIDQNQAALTTERAQEERRIAAALMRLAELEAEERALARRISRLMPWPTSLATLEIDGAPIDFNATDAQAAVQQAGELARQKAEVINELGTSAPSSLPEAPAALTVGPGLLRLYRATEPEDYQAARDLFLAAQLKAPHLPEPFLGRGLAEARLANFAAAAEALEQAHGRAVGHYGPQSPQTRQVRALIEQLDRQLP